MPWGVDATFTGPWNFWGPFLEESTGPFDHLAFSCAWRPVHKIKHRLRVCMGLRLLKLLPESLDKEMGHHQGSYTAFRALKKRILELCIESQSLAVIFISTAYG